MSTTPEMTEKETGRGFDLVEFKDAYGKPCNIQETMTAVSTNIWMGVADPFMSGRMLLTQDHVKAMLPYLIRFAETGVLK
jgi:hypothetical protein